ncbi:MAG: ATP synthase F1 subunit delta [Planctomycetota bacterium]|jgi:F-type H+-transporting ATPase subunit delta
MSLIANRYARALYESASGKEAVEKVQGDLAKLGEALQDEALRALILDPDIPASKRAELLRKLVAEAHVLTRSLIDVLIHRRRFEILDDIPAAYAALVREQRGEELGIVESAQALVEDQLARLEERASKLSGKKVTLEQVTNPELIGGVRLRVGNTLYDSSVASALEELERQLLEVPIH